jgi:hypothetical protein
MRRGTGDLVPMPLPTEWGPTVIPQGTPPLPSIPAGSTIGYQQVSGGWILAIRAANGNVTAVPGATVVPYPGAQATPPGNGSGVLPDDSAAYIGGTVGANPSDPPNMYPGVYPGGGLAPAGQLIVPRPTTGRPVPMGSTAPGAPWGRPPILPDSLLPPALQRGNPSIRHTVWYPNAFDRVIAKRTALWGYIREHGGLKGCCRIPELGAPVYQQPPWMVMPSQGEPFTKMFPQPIANVSGGGPFTGVDTILGQFVVPNGYDGALNRFVCQFTGNGFLDFTGAIVWRVLVNNRFARNLGNVQNTFGDYKTAFLVPGTDNIRLVSQQTVTLIANIPIGSPVSDGYVTAGAFGWFYPRR